jgi:protein TonB
MMEGAFYQQKKTSPTALAIVVLMHGAAITALAMAKGEAIREAFGTIKVVNIKEKQPPPPEPVKPIEKAATPKTVITHTPPVVQMPAPPTPVVLQPLPPVQQVVVYDPPVAPPVAVEPAPAAKPRKVEPARARANLASYVSDEDYPNAAVRNEEQGTTRFRLGVGPDGRVSECTITGSSGSPALDSATCRLMKQRARFVPARNSAGEPTSDSVASAIRWVLPD